jgi:putative selenium metabolism protein SsnA
MNYIHICTIIKLDMLKYFRGKMIISNSIIITWADLEPLLIGKDVVVIDEKIVEIGSHAEILKKYPDENVIDAGGKFLMPGLICAHTHFYGLFSRGMNIPGPTPSNFLEILNKLWWPLDSSLEIEDVKSSALVCLIDAIKHGTTTLFDHHASPNCIEGSLDCIGDAFYETGVRGVVCYETTDRYGKSSMKRAVEENLRMIKKVKTIEPSKRLVNATFGVHAGLTVSDSTLGFIRNDLPKDTGIHIHVAEDKSDENDSLKKSGMRVIDRLKYFDLLGVNSIIVHGVHLIKNEMFIIKNTESWVTHQPRSNMNNAVGIPDVEKMIKLGIKVCLGNDGFSNAMWDEWRTCYLVHKLINNNPSSMGGNTTIDLAVKNNGKIATHFFQDQLIGKILPGYQADLILVDYIPITEINENNFPWHILFGFRDSMVTDTMVKGKWLLRNRDLVNLDEIEISKKALELSKVVWKRYTSKF